MMTMVFDIWYYYLLYDTLYDNYRYRAAELYYYKHTYCNSSTAAAEQTHFIIYQHMYLRATM